MIFLNIMFLCAGAICAQDGLNTNAVFNGNIVPQDAMVKVKVKGKALSKYNLSFYHSVRFKASDRQLKLAQQLFDKDAATAIGTSETREKGKTTDILCLPPRGDVNRYLCRFAIAKGTTTEITLVYMEGRVKNIAELRQRINSM